MKMSDKCWRFLADIAKAKVFRDMMHALEVLDFERKRREAEKCKDRKYGGMSRADYRQVWDNMNEPGYLENIDNQLKQRGKIILSLTETPNDEQMVVKEDGGSDSESVDNVSSNL
jgi:hypothetical protein